MTGASTADQVLEKLKPYGLKQEPGGQFRSNRPWSPGSDSNGLSIKIDDCEHGVYTDYVSGESGSLFDLAGKLGISTPGKNGRHPAIETNRVYNDLIDYVRTHGVGDEVYRDAGWKEERYPFKGDYYNRRALKFPPKNGDSWRFLDGEEPKYISTIGNGAP